ncbi:unnamed protein product, partial [Amoebophrya sp. A25]
QSIAKRVAEEYGTTAGELVGFRVGSRGGGSGADSKKICAKTVIEFVTEGLLLFQLSRSPESFANFDCIVIDEAHERNKETDLLLALCRNHLRTPGHSPLKVVVMSASIDPTRFRDYFDGCPTVDCPGKIFPVEEYYRPPPALPRPEDDGEPKKKSGKPDIVAHAVDVLFDDVVNHRASGDVLIFLSGSKQIMQCVDRINARAKETVERRVGVVAYPLFASMPEEEKRRSTDPDHRAGVLEENGKNPAVCGEDSSSMRKVICCTNIAETSLTIDGVAFVLDGGTANKQSYNHELRSAALGEELVSRASTMQRRGRAGRTRAGYCFYLYSETTHKETMPPYETPQILQTSVDALILYALNVQGKSIEQIGLLDCPPGHSVADAKERLLDLELIRVVDGSEPSKAGPTLLELTEEGKLA